MLELLVEKCLLCCEGGIGSLSPGNALRRIFECIASGILFSGKGNVHTFFRWTLLSRPNKWVSNIRLSVRMFVRPSTAKLP